MDRIKKYSEKCFNDISIGKDLTTEEIRRIFMIGFDRGRQIGISEALVSACVYFDDKNEREEAKAELDSMLEEK